MNTLNDYEIGFISCFIDTDGSICLDSRKDGRFPMIRVYFYNNSVPLLEKVRDILGVDNKILLKKGSKNYLLRLSAGKSEELLRQVKLVVKEKKRKITFRLIEERNKIKGRRNRFTVTEEYKQNLKQLVDEFHNS